MRFNWTGSAKTVHLRGSFDGRKAEYQLSMLTVFFLVPVHLLQVYAFPFLGRPPASCGRLFGEVVAAPNFVSITLSLVPIFAVYLEEILCLYVTTYINEL